MNNRLDMWVESTQKGMEQLIICEGSFENNDISPIAGLLSERVLSPIKNNDM